MNNSGPNKKRACVEIVKIENHFGMGLEHIRTPAYHFPPKLPPFAMLATFATFAVASRNFFSKHVHSLRMPLQQRPTQQPTHLVLVASML